MDTDKPSTEVPTGSLAWAPLHGSPRGPRRALLSRRQAEALISDLTNDPSSIQEREASRLERAEVDKLLSDIDAEFEAERSPWWDYLTKTQPAPVLTPWMRLSEEEKAEVRAARRRSRLTVLSGDAAADRVRRAA